MSNTLNLKAKMALYFLLIGTVLLLGGIAYQIIIGVSMMNLVDEAIERFGFMLMSRGSILLIIAYTVIFISGIIFWLVSPFKLRQDRWFFIVFLCFYIWFPVDIYTIILDIKFAIQFSPTIPITDELKSLFMSRRQSLGPIPVLQLLGYLTAIGMAIFRPAFKRENKS